MCQSLNKFLGPGKARSRYYMLLRISRFPFHLVRPRVCLCVCMLVVCVCVCVCARAYKRARLRVFEDALMRFVYVRAPVCARGGVMECVSA